MIIDAHVHVSPHSFLDVKKKLRKANIKKAVAIVWEEDFSQDFLKKLKKDKSFFVFLEINRKKYFNRKLIDGIKLHPRLRKFSVSDKTRQNVFSKCQNLKLPILIDTYNSLNIAQYDILAKKYPSLQIILAHAGAPQIWNAFSLASMHKNIYLEISYFIRKFKKTSIVNDLKKICEMISQKIIYGSDFPECDIGFYLKETKILLKSFSKYKKDKIFHKNILSLLK